MARRSEGDAVAMRTDDMVSRLSRTLAAANAYLSLLLRRAGLNGLVPSHGDVLMRLFAEEPLTMHGLAESIHRDPSTVTALVKKLVECGYVESARASDDRRKTEVRLTPKGRALREEFDAISHALVSAQTEGIDADDLAVTARTLARMKDNLERACNEEKE